MTDAEETVFYILRPVSCLYPPFPSKEKYVWFLPLTRPRRKELRKVSPDYLYEDMFVHYKNTEFSIEALAYSAYS